MIKLDYRSDKPLHEQIELSIRTLIVSGALKAEERLPSVRDMSVSLTVNPNTVQRAYKELEAQGLIYSVRGKGNFVSEAIQPDSGRVSELYDNLINTVRELAYFGEPAQEIIKVINNIYIGRG